MSKLNKALLFLNFAFIAVIISVGAVLAWTGPSSNPPTGSGLLYYANNNVGIGTQAPGQKLTVAGTVESTSGGFKFPDSTIQTSAATSSVSQWTTSGNNIYNSNSGNVGIGTTNPQYLLDVTSNVALSSAENDATVNIGAMTNFHGYIQSLNSYAGGAGGTIIGHTYTSAGTGIVFRFGSTQTSTSDKMTILGSGNVGIGTTTPAQKLDVNGTVQMTGFKLPTSATNGYVLTSDSNGVGTWQATGGGGGGWTDDGAAVRLTTSGDNVGIGTASPACKLDVVGGGYTGPSGGLRVKGSIATSIGPSASVIDFDDDPSAQNFRLISFGPNASTKGNFSFIVAGSDGTGWSSAMDIKANGNIGIGTTAPASKLHVAGSIFYTNRNMPSTGIGVEQYYDTGSDWGVIQSRDYGASAYKNLLLSGNDLILYAGGSERARIKSSGNVGIGTASPGEKLEVAGNIRFGSNGYLFGDDGNSYFGDGASLVSGAATTDTGILTGGNIVFGTNAGAGNYERMRISSTGNVGIGTTNPAYKLAVIGPANDWTVVVNQDNDKAYGVLSYGTTYAGYFEGPGYKSGTTWIYGSDKRLKENITYFGNGLDKILQLQPARFDFIAGEKSQLGFIAQDVQGVIPEAVVVVDEKTGMLGLKTNFIIPYLVNATKELNAKVDPAIEVIKEQQVQIGDLKAENEELKQRIELLEARIK